MAAVRKIDNKRERYLTLGEVAQLGAAFDSLDAEDADPTMMSARSWLAPKHGLQPAASEMH